MDELRFRQVHLDFHTSEKIDGIGKDFDKKQFQDMLKLGHVNTINIFAKCHHGWGYNADAKANEPHPGLKINLLKEMIDACHEIGVLCPTYLSAGLDEKVARSHPEWLFRNKNESTTWASNFDQPGYHMFCMNSGYLEYLKSHVLEILADYNGDGIWLDIVGERLCYCQNCIKLALEKGYDPENVDDMLKLGKETYIKYYQTINNAIKEVAPESPIFHNSGHIKRGRYDLMGVNTHLEIESLPTGGWGYDNFPLSARYLQNVGKEFLGMTGKFHSTWGEFGGFKHPNALRYESSLALSVGAKFSIGDQMHPYGKLEFATYELIGKAYSEVEAKEEYCRDTTNVAQIAFITVEAGYATGNIDKEVPNDKAKASDLGALRILQEGQYLFDIIDASMQIDKYKIVVLPDYVRLDDSLKAKLEKFISNGGKILSTGDSGLLMDEDKFGIDLGVTYKGVDPYCPAYVHPEFDLKDLSKSAYVMYSEANLIEKAEGTTTLAYNESSFFNRSTFAFSSHFHTPNNPDAKADAIIESKNGIYVPWKMFAEYSTTGHIINKQIIHQLIDRLLGEDKMLKSNLCVPGVITVRNQPTSNRHLVHVLYGCAVKRGNVEVIEDIPTIHNTTVTLKCFDKVGKVYEAVGGKELSFTFTNGVLEFTIPEFNCHTIIVVE